MGNAKLIIRKLLHRQLWHLLYLVVLLGIIGFLLPTYPPLISGGISFLPTSFLIFVALLIPPLHQLYVMIVWRVELHLNLFSNYFGSQGFALYKIGFSILFAGRLVTIILVAIANAWTLPLPRSIAWALAALLHVPVIYLAWSVKKYFGIDRAYGIDHFRPSEYRNKTWVKQGIFRYTDNSMYIFGLMVLYLPGLILLSPAALLMALYNHLFIWGHYFCTEQPDMKEIYGELPGR